MEEALARWMNENGLLPEDLKYYGFGEFIHRSELPGYLQILVSLEASMVQIYRTFGGAVALTEHYDE